MPQNYVRAKGLTIEDLMEVVNNFLGMHVRAIPLGAPFYADSVWNQMIYKDRK